jgi:hypothetical protein
MSSAVTASAMASRLGLSPTAVGQLTGIAGLTERILITQLMWWYALRGWKAYRTANNDISEGGSVVFGWVRGGDDVTPLLGA